MDYYQLYITLELVLVSKRELEKCLAESYIFKNIIQNKKMSSDKVIRVALSNMYIPIIASVL